MAERVLSLVLLGDLVSLYLAVLRGVDPTPLPITDQLKSRLAQAPVDVRIPDTSSPYTAGTGMSRAQASAMFRWISMSFSNS